MKLRSALLGIIAAALVMIFILVTPASDVRADDMGECVAYINDVEASPYNTPSNALEVDINDVVNIKVIAPAPLASYQIDVACTDLFAWTISEETVDGNQTSYMTTIEVRDYADYGVGLYKVKAIGVLENGDTCSAVAFINVTGVSVLGTVAGVSSLGLAVLGTFGLSLLTLLVWLGTIGSASTFNFCLWAIPITAVLTTVSMVTNGDEKPSSGDDQTTGTEDTPHVPSGSQDTSRGGIKLCPKIAMIAIGCALLAAFSFDVLFQQLGVLYPTTTAMVLSLIGGMVVAILCQTIAATSPRRPK